jgi:hypothetical protein
MLIYLIGSALDLYYGYNKSTGKSYLLVAFMEFVVIHANLLDEFRIIYLCKGHSVNDQVSRADVYCYSLFMFRTEL